MPKNKWAISIQVEPAYRGRVSTPSIRQAVKQTLLYHTVTPAQVGRPWPDPQPAIELSLVITGDEQIQALNRQYRDVDTPTDVLAFASCEDSASQPFVSAPDVPLYLGDVILSYPHAEAQALAGPHPVEAELQLLVVHGVLHLLGYDHATPDEQRVMWDAQAAILSQLGVSINLKAASD